MTAKRRIGVLMGGPSSEREVSLKTGAGVKAALESLGHDVVAIDWTPQIELAGALLAAKVDAVWIALHGTWGEDGCVQGMLECLKIPYTGSGVCASAVAMDKQLSKTLFALAGVPTPPGAILQPGPDEGARARAIAAKLGWPVVVKPTREGSTVGITVVPDEVGEARSALPSEGHRPLFDAALALARSCHGEVLLEAFIPGREISVGILDGEVLGSVEIRPRVAVYDYAAKYTRGDTEYLVPAPVSAEIAAVAAKASAAAYTALGCAGHARADLRIDDSKGPDGVFVLEINTLPGMTGTSLLPKVAAHAGLDYATLVARILRTATLRA